MDGVKLGRKQQFPLSSVFKPDGHFIMVAKLKHKER